MLVSEGMSTVVLTVGPSQPLREVAKAMTERNVGAAVVLDPDAPGPGIVTERDVLRAYAADRSTGGEPVSQHSTERAVFATPSWSLEQAAEEMARGNFRHLIVIDGGAVVGILSMRDIVKSWTKDGATSDMPAVTG